MIHSRVGARAISIGQAEASNEYRAFAVEAGRSIASRLFQVNGVMLDLDLPIWCAAAKNPKMAKDRCQEVIPQVVAIR